MRGSDVAAEATRQQTLFVRLCWATVQKSFLRISRTGRAENASSISCDVVWLCVAHCRREKIGALRREGRAGWGCEAVGINRGANLPRGGVNTFLIPYALKNTESFINKFTNKCSCLYNLFNVGGGAFETKDDHLRGRVVEKRLRTRLWCEGCATRVVRRVRSVLTESAKVWPFSSLDNLFWSVSVRNENNFEFW